jgi:hypothetical protein
VTKILGRTIFTEKSPTRIILRIYRKKLEQKYTYINCYILEFIALNMKQSWVSEAI